MALKAIALSSICTDNHRLPQPTPDELHVFSSFPTFFLSSSQYKKRKRSTPRKCRSSPRRQKLFAREPAMWHQLSLESLAVQPVIFSHNPPQLTEMQRFLRLQQEIQKLQGRWPSSPLGFGRKRGPSSCWNHWNHLHFRCSCDIWTCLLQGTDGTVVADC